MEFGWDARKAKTNAAKHGVEFEAAITAFDDPFALIASDPAHSTASEDRWIAASSAPDERAERSDGGMTKPKEFPFERARRVTAREVEAARKGIEAKLGTKRPRRGRPPKSTHEKYRPVSIRLHPKVVEWAKKEARRRGVGYQTVINEALLRATA